MLRSACRGMSPPISFKISGFGTFSVRQKGRRVGRNPKTGQEVPIMPRRVLVFRPSNVLKARVNGTTPIADDDE
jgi:integration host factor subunit alpha